MVTFDLSVNRLVTRFIAEGWSISDEEIVAPDVSIETSGLVDQTPFHRFRFRKPAAATPLARSNKDIGSGTASTVTSGTTGPKV